MGRGVFYIAADIEDTDVWASLTQRDTTVYHDNDFEVYIDPDGDTHEYYELSINAHGAIRDLLLLKPYRDRGSFVKAWDIAGLKAGVQVWGTLNDPQDTATLGGRWNWPCLGRSWPNAPIVRRRPETGIHGG